ncbi:kelch repeat-containing protein [Hymenobacter chitinivorans]|uniref:Putative secreted protein (Por secretion system target) n=1 Tax=Hymenobacter chitinivorans DSM 11115 TaxID=1121954 RepID=A0A2M9B5X8_9BACT|nr:kelch repeat-containing protein [Hymenobacter chitinivorans]PJJ53338.1 putative secreted protein (Por secretion system target) [Hymenobacter chitinivorans DSM 11115]
MRTLLPAAALAAFLGSLSAPARAQQHAALPVNTIGSGPATAARAAAISSWTSLAAMPERQSNGGVAVLNGKIYVFGGYLRTITNPGGDFTKQVQVYDIATNTWSKAADMPFRITANGGVAKDGLLYNFSGSIVDNVPQSPSTSLVYNPGANTWATSTFANYPYSQAGTQSTTNARAWIGLDGKIYVHEPERSVLALDPVANTWGQDITPPNIDSRFQDRYAMAMVMDGSGQIHAFGGGQSGTVPGAYQQANTRHAVYTPATGVWTTAAPLPVAKLGASAVLGSDGNLYVLGGGANSSSATSDVQIYNPTTGTWSTGPALPQSLIYANTVTQGNDIYIVTATATYRATVTVAGLSWTGAVSSSWTDAGNWSGGVVPTANDDVTIPAGLSRYPSISTSTPTAKQLTLASGAQLILADGGTLSLTGNLVNNGTFSAAGAGSLAFTGSTAQTLGGTASTTLQNLNVGAAGAILAGPVTVQRQLTLTGNLSTTGQRLVLASSNAGTALVVNSGGVVSGPVTVQRYIDPATNPGFGYRHYSPAVLGATLNNLSMATTPQATVGVGPLQLNDKYNSAAEPSLVTPFPTVLAYDQSRVGTVAGASGFNQGWASPVAASQVLVGGQGLTINEPAGILFEITGPTLTSGAVAVGGLTRSSEPDAGWQLVGNPYPSPIDWNRVSRTNLQAAAYVYRSLSRYEGGYTAYVNGVGSNIIAQGQAFFVRVSAPGASGSLAFSDASRETSYQDPTYARPAQAETRPLVQLILQRQDHSDAASQDQFYVYEQDGATIGFDADYDAVKVQLNGGQQPSLYQVVGAQGLAIQGLPTGRSAQRLNLGVHVAAAGSYVFSAAQVLNQPAAEPLWLEDQLTGTWHDLRQGSYAVSLSAGLSTTRFVLHLHQAPLLSSQKASTWAGELQLYPNPASSTAPVTVVASGVAGNSAEVVLLNSVGQRVLQRHLAVAGKEVRAQLAVSGLAQGIYTVQVRSQAGVLTRQLVIQ